ncbi:MAG: pyridoxamine 5'-phosphate oxidase family protein [Bacillota bacterium]
MVREIRRKEKALDNTEAIEILKHCDYGILSSISENGYPYGVPVFYAYFNDAIYLHCALEGHKTDNLRSNDKVSFCVVGATSVLPEKFTAKYESVVVFGRAKEVFDEEKHAALMELLNKYSPDYMEKGKEYIKNANAKTKVMKVCMEHLSGKAQR